VATFRGNVLLAFFVIKNIVINYVSSRETYKQKEQEGHNLAVPVLFVLFIQIRVI
jgi:hypothetical protein